MLLGWIERLGYRWADMIVGTMPNLVEHVREVCGHDRPVICIPQGLDPALLNPADPLHPNYVSKSCERANSQFVTLVLLARITPLKR